MFRGSYSNIRSLIRHLFLCPVWHVSDSCSEEMALPQFRFDHEVPSLSSPFYVDTLALATWRPTDRIPFFNLKGSWENYKRNGEAREMHSFGKSWILIRYLLSALCCKLYAFNGHIYINTRYTHSKPGMCGKAASWQGQGGAACVCIWTASKRKASRSEGRAPLSSLAEWESRWRGSLTFPGCGACVLACEAYIYVYI